jgi:hypothetical protein
MSDDPNNISQNNEQLITDIQLLQQMEQQLFNNLETNSTLTSQEQEKIIEKINQISNMRINLYQTLSGVNSFFQNALSSSVGTLQEQTTAIHIVENELNQSKRRLEALEAERNNKIRLVEINNYYSDKYVEHSQLMKIIIFTLVPITLLAILNNKGFLPNSIYYTLIVIISLIGAFFFWRRYASIILRDNMNYQEYSWPMNASALPKATSTTTSSDPWKSNISSTCIGENCCSEGLSWDSTIGQCIAAINDATTTETFVNQNEMINNVLTKKQIGKYKDDYNMSTNIQAPMSKSFINNSKM